MAFAWPVDKEWTLFLDRDDVINKRRSDDYVKSWREFEFLEGSLEALSVLSRHFKRLIVVTNQQGVGKGMMTQANLDEIHACMLDAIRARGGEVHAIYAAIARLEDDREGMRKPAVGMAMLAQRDFPDTDFAKSVMVGDTVQDMQFGRSVGMVTVFIGSLETVSADDIDSVDACYSSLAEFASALDA